MEVNSSIVCHMLALMRVIVYLGTEPNQLTMPCTVNMEL